ncbi:MAG: hypothetical protein IKI11_11725 [Neisseriaceae bacterium]|nr:hypothetical protein [Neisseriaceae bacterium]
MKFAELKKVYTFSGCLKNILHCRYIDLRHPNILATPKYSKDCFACKE